MGSVCIDYPDCDIYSCNLRFNHLHHVLAYYLREGKIKGEKGVEKINEGKVSPTMSEIINTRDHHDIYDFVNPLKNSELKASTKGKSVIITGAGEGIGRVRNGRTRGYTTSAYYVLL